MGAGLATWILIPAIADVRGMQGRDVVHAVTGHRHDVTACAKGPGDAELVLLVEAEATHELIGDGGLARTTGAGDAENRRIFAVFGDFFESAGDFCTEQFRIVFCH